MMKKFWKTIIYFREEKTELTIELQEELQDLKSTSSKLRNENLELTQDARSARAYRDELDILKEKVGSNNTLRYRQNTYRRAIVCVSECTMRKCSQKSQKLS